MTTLLPDSLLALTQTEYGRSQPRGNPQVAVTQVAVLFRLGLEQENITLAEVARAMGTSWAASQRLENPRRGHHLKQLEKAARALGKQLVIAFEPLGGPQESSVLPTPNPPLLYPAGST